MPLSTGSVQEAQFSDLMGQLGQLPTFQIGRSPDNQIVVANPKISSRHARLIQCTLTSFLLEDLASKNGTFVNGTRITRKIVGPQDVVRLADVDYRVDELLKLRPTEKLPAPKPEKTPAAPVLVTQPAKNVLDFTSEFAELKPVFEQYPDLRKACRNRDKMIRTGSVLLSAVVGISTAALTGGGTLLLHMLSGAGLSVLIPTLCSTILSTDEKLEVIDKEYRERYRCPNPACRDPFQNREWEQLAQQKTCRRCDAIWVK